MSCCAGRVRSTRRCACTMWSRCWRRLGLWSRTFVTRRNSCSRDSSWLVRGWTLTIDHWHVSIWRRWGSSWFVKCWVTLTSEVIGRQRNSSQLMEGWITIDWQVAAAEILHDWLNYGLDNTLHLGTPESLLLLLCSGWVVQFSYTLFISAGAILSDVSVNHLNLKALPLLGCTAFQCRRSQVFELCTSASMHTHTHTHTNTHTHT